MKALATQAAYSPFLERLRCAPERILMLDYDGTLAPFVPNRDQAVPYPGVLPLVARIMSSGTRVVLITGRSARQLADLVSLLPCPEIWGSHGIERLTSDGRYTLAPEAERRSTAFAAAVKCLQGKESGQHLEIKPGGIALHWRALDPDQAAKLKEEAIRLWSPLLAQHGLELHDFDGGLELRVPGHDKGQAVRTILAEAGPDAALAYLGDDRTDEDAFRALTHPGLTVLVRSQPRPTAAEIWLQPPNELIHFLEEWLHACGGEA